VIHNGISLVEEIETKAHTKHVGFVGRLVPPKDPLLCLDVASRLRDFQITMIGGGELERAVNEKILGYNLTNVHMLGTLHHNQVLEELPKFSVMIITSRWEGLPYLPMEAMWRQVPVVAINVGGIGEIIENEESGLLVNNRSADELARAVRRLEQEPGLREQIVQQGRVRVKDLFSNTQMLGKIQGVYERA
jgi:glycosyltransferase involved in cell wall biosynthesis